MLGWLLLAMAVPQAAEPDPCVKPEACRKVGSIMVRGAGGKPFALAIDQTLPWVTRDNLLLLPGDWIIITLADRGGALVPQLVRAGSDAKPPEPAPGEIRVHIPLYNGGPMIMSVLSRRTDTLDYAAAIVTPKGPERTSVCSLQPGITVYESWDQAIRQFALWSFRPTTEPGCKTLDFPKKK